MARRNFAVELDDKIKADSVAALMKRPADPGLLQWSAGYVQGLTAAKLLYDEILQAALKDED